MINMTRTLSFLILTTLSFLLLSGCDRRENSVALGTLERDRIAHTATANEVVVALPIPQGSFVTKGTVLVKLDDTQQQAIVAKAKAEVAQAEAHLEKLLNGAREEEVAAAQATVEGFKAALVEAEANYERAVKLVERKLESQSTLDKALASRDSVLANLHAAQEQLRELTNGTREEDLRMGEAQLAAAQATLASEQKKLQDLTIIATRDGILDNLPWNLGERVTLGSPLAMLLAGKTPFARVYVPEPYRVHVNVGDSFDVAVDGIETPFKGKVRWISTEPAFSPYYALNQEERARLMYLAEVQLPDSAADLPNGVPAQVFLK